MRNILLLLIVIFSISSATAQWQPCAGTEGNYITKIVKAGNVLFAGTQNNIFHGKILKSTDNGISWDSVNTGFSFSSVFDMAALGNTVCAGTYESGLVWSTNAGVSWQVNSINGNNGNGVFKTAVSGNIILAYNNTVPSGTGQVFFYSSNNGSVWNPVIPVPSLVPITFVNYDSVLISGHKYGVAFSSNNGLTWSIPANSGLPSFPDGRKELYSVLKLGGMLYAGCIGGFAYSTNMGVNWSAVNLGFPSFAGFFDLISYNNSIYGAVYNPANQSQSGIWRSDNAGLNWVQLNSGLPSAHSVNSLLISGGYLFAGLAQNGVYRIPLSQITSVKGESSKPEEYSLSQNYPNPYNSSTVIEFSLLRKGNITLVVYDLSGREAFKLINGEMPAGRHEYRFNGSSLSSGVYFYKLSADNYSQIRKMILLK